MSLDLFAGSVFLQRHKVLFCQRSFRLSDTACSTVLSSVASTHRPNVQRCFGSLLEYTQTVRSARSRISRQDGLRPGSAATIGVFKMSSRSGRRLLSTTHEQQMYVRVLDGNPPPKTKIFGRLEIPDHGHTGSSSTAKLVEVETKHNL